MPIYRFEEHTPVIDESSYVDPSAIIIGNVTIGRNCYIGPGASLRGDWGEIIIGDGSNVQDNAVIHARPGQSTILGKDSHIGHAAVVHGATLEEHVLVGMGAIINDGAKIGYGCIIGSGALVPPGFRAPERKLLYGVPAEIKRDVDEDTDKFLRMGTMLYQTLPERYTESCEKLN